VKVRVARQALDDLDRLQSWLIERDAEGPAGRALEAIWNAIDTLATFPQRGRSLGRDDRKELIVPFGRSAYFIQYRIWPDRILVARIRHSRERR
jgi:plasmid stabilization system protein ParE